jgi:D-tagatose-1,6-bisphosphate aldolase subunit GatZ/KbaZ
MMIHLGQASIPLTLLSQYFPQEYVEVREGELKPSPRELVLRRITRVLEDYEVACRG